MRLKEDEISFGHSLLTTYLFHVRFLLNTSGMSECLTYQKHIRLATETSNLIKHINT